MALEIVHSDKEWCTEVVVADQKLAGTSGGVSKFNYAYNTFATRLAAFQSFISATPLLPSSTGEKYFFFISRMTMIVRS